MNKRILEAALIDTTEGWTSDAYSSSFILIQSPPVGKGKRLTTVIVVAETDTEVGHVERAPVTETVLVLTAIEEQSVEGKPVVVGHVFVIVEVTVTVGDERDADFVGEVVVFVEEDVVVIKQEHAELTREGELPHFVENGPKPEAVAV